MEPKRLEFDSEAIVAARPDWCGGALLKLTDEGLAELKSMNVRFSSVVKFNEFHDARVMCDGFVTKREGYSSGLCNRCTALEGQAQAILRGNK